MKQKLWRGWGLLLALMLLLCACGEEPPQLSEIPAPEEPRSLAVSVIPGRENELLFDFTLDQWIAAFNEEYSYLSPEEEWRHWTVERGIHSPHESVYYEFVADETMYALPFLSAYTRESDGRVQELTVNFDDHAYQDAAYELYEELCFHAIKTVLPSLTDEKVVAVYTALNEQSYDELRLNNQHYDSDVIPLCLYYKDGVGIYGHFALGDYVRLCIIPVTEESLRDFAQKGTQLCPLDGE